MTKPSSLEAIELEKKYASFNYAPLPVVLSRGEGPYAWDAEGKRYLDFVSGFSALNQGHCHPRLVKVAQDQVARLTLVSRALYSDQLGPFAQYASELLGYERILVMNSGAEAFDTAVKLARKWGYQKKGIPQGQAKVVVCDDNFHGRTLGAVAASGNVKHHEVFGPVMEGFIRLPFGDSEALEKALRDPNVCAFVVEPMQGEAGAVVPPAGYLQKAQELCHSQKVLFVADEIQTGLGRTGRLLCVHHDNLRPDVVLLGKALSGGLLPVSAVLSDTPIMECLQPGDHGSTFGGNPLACAVAHEALRVIADEKLSERSETLGSLFRESILNKKLPHVKDVRGRGLLNALVFDFSGAKDSEGHDEATRFCLRLRDYGLLAKPTRPNIIRFTPPLVITEAQLREGIDIIEKALR